MSTAVQRKPKAGGLLSTLVEVALSFGLYYLLRAFGVGVFWALTAPAVAVAAVTAFVTLRRRRIDMIGLLVLCELAATIILSLVTRNARVAAVREPVYFLIAGVFCLATLARRTPFSHVSTAAIATFGDPKRERAFQVAWDVPAYRVWQRLITAVFGVLMIGSGVVRIVILSHGDVGHAVNVSNVVSLVTIGALVAVSAILIQPPRKIIEELLERM
jgi:hypothetical protein